jgi:hypothetical protein
VREGLVAERVVAPGSKSERRAVVLETADGELVLRRRGANPFKDPELDALVGRRIRADGDVRGHTLIMDAWEEI